MAIASVVLASTLAAHPFAMNRAAFGAAEGTMQMAEDAQLAPAAEPPPPVVVQINTPAPPPAQPPLERTPTRRGIGLMVTAGVTGSLAWGASIGRMVLVNRCATAVETANIQATSNDCLFRATTGLSVLTPVGWALNWATWGLAAGAGATRGRYDGVGAAWDGSPDRKPAAYVAVGASLLGLGIAGRIATLTTFRYAVSQCSDGADDCATAIRLNFLGTQLAATSAGVGIGMMVYGLVYRGARRREERRIRDHGSQVLSSLQLSPQFDGTFTGMGVAGRF